MDTSYVSGMEEMQLILPIPIEGGAEAGLISRLRYAVDTKLGPRSAAPIRMLLPAEGEGAMAGVVHALVLISGSRSQVEENRQLLMEEIRSCMDNASYQMGEDACVKSPLPAIVSEVIGRSVLAAEEPGTELVSQGALAIGHVSVSPIALSRILGAQGREKVRWLLDRQVLLDVPSLVLDRARGQDGLISVKLVAGSVDALGAAREALIEEGKISNGDEQIRQPLCLTYRQIEWLLHHNRTQVEQVLLETQTVLIRDGDEVELVGRQGSAVEAAQDQIGKILFRQHYAKLLLDHHQHRRRQHHQTLGDIAKAMEKTAQVSGAEICVGPGTFGEGPVIEMMGTVEQLRQAFYHLQAVQKLITHQVRYHLYEKEEIRDFVSGKKDGKLVKITKETGVSLHLQSCPEEEREGSDRRLSIELSGECIAAVLSALDMLMGEFPAELSFYLPEAHHRRLIGHGGKTIQRVMKRHAVYVKFLNPEEALRQAGEAARHLPPALQTSLPNVLIRTPAKNRPALEDARNEILEMAEEAEVRLLNKRLRLSLPTADVGVILARCVASFADNLDFTADSNAQARPFGLRAPKDQMEIVINGHSGTLSRFLHTLQLQIMSLGTIEETVDEVAELCCSPAEGGSVPASPTRSLAAASEQSQASSCHSWSSESPELFRHFGCTLLEPIKTIASPASPTLLSPVVAVPAERRESCWGFDPAIGSQRSSIFKDDTNERMGTSLWNGPAFPKLSMMTIDSLWKRRSTEMESLTAEMCRLDWKTMTADRYRRRASTVFRGPTL